MTAPVNSQDLLNTLEQRVEKQLQESIRVFQNMDEQALLRPSANGGWSIAQCLWHLNSYGHFYLPHIGQGLAQSRAHHNTVFKSSWLGNYFTRMMKPDVKGKKYKAIKAHIPPAALDAHSVVSEFIAQLEQLLDHLRQARQADLNAIKVPVSIAGWVKLKLGDVFQFIITHNDRHLLQARRNVASADKT